MKTLNVFTSAFIKSVLITEAFILSANAMPLEVNGLCENRPRAICFTPNEQCEYLIIKAIDSAKTELLIQAYHITNHAIIKHILNAKDRGVIVELIVDKAAQREIEPFINANIPVWVDYKPKIAHNKVMVIDRNTVITGSFNFTQNALRNAENVVIFKDTQAANRYRDNFNYRITQSRGAK